MILNNELYFIFIFIFIFIFLSITSQTVTVTKSHNYMLQKDIEGSRIITLYCMSIAYNIYVL